MNNPVASAALFEELKRKAWFALKSRSRCLVYECHGAAQMARHLGAISRKEARELNDMLVVKGLNNPAYCREHYGGELK